MSRQRIGIISGQGCNRNQLRPAARLLCCAAVVSTAALFSATIAPRIGFADPEFERYSVAAWAREQSPSPIRWQIEISPPELSTHQRMIVRLVTRIDGRDLAKRRGSGEIIAFIQFRDSSGQIWQNHASFDLASMPDGARSIDLTITQYAFLLPGDYTVTAAICDSKTLEHGAALRKLHVAPLRTDPLPQSWAGLPPVEFVPAAFEPPDVWYIPDITHNLNLTLRTQRPVHIQVVVNTTPSEKSAGNLTALRRNMSVVMPALKVISGIQVINGSMDAALLDLTHRRVSFEQKNLHQLDWDKMRDYFMQNNPGVIDARSLAGQWKMRKFFWDEVSRRVKPAGDALPVVIVLSGPAFLEDQEPVESIPHFDGARRVFYIRYRTLPMMRGRGLLSRSTGARPARGLLGPPQTQYVPMGVDDLERTVEPLGARLFDATSAAEFRRILASVLDQISRL